MIPYEAVCHCGAVKIQMHRRIRKMTRCNCSICRRYGAFWAYQQRKAVVVSDKNGELRSYKWGNGKIEFFHCGSCGCATHYEQSDRREDGSDICAVNMRNISDPARIEDLPVRLLDGARTWKVLREGLEPHILMSPFPKERGDPNADAR